MVQTSNWIIAWWFFLWNLWIYNSYAQSTVIEGWEQGNFVLPNDDEWTVLGYLNALKPNRVHIFGGIKFPKQHYVFNLKTQAVNHFRDVPVAMHTHVQPVSLGNRTYFMNDRDRTFYTIDLINFAVQRLATQPTRDVPRVCIAENSTHLFMLGGLDVTTQLGTNNAQVFSLRTKTWLALPVPRMITSRYDFGCGIDPNNGRLYAIGGQVGPNTFTAQIEFINSRDIVTGRWRKFKFSLAQPMALYNNALVPTIIAQGQNRRTLLVHELSSTRHRTLQRLRRLQQAPPPEMCNYQVDTVIVIDESCGWSMSTSQCFSLRTHLLNLVDLYNISSKNRFGIVGYSDSAVTHLDLSDGDQRDVVVNAIAALECGNGAFYNSSNLHAGIDEALQMFSENSTASKSMIIYPICSAVDDTQDPPSFACTPMNSNVQLEDVTVSVYVSGNHTQAEYYACLINSSRASNSYFEFSQYLFDNSNFDVQQYQENAASLMTTQCIEPKKFNFVQFVITGGFSGGCCPENTTCPDACSNPRDVWSIDVTENPNDLRDPCIAARYYNNSDIECGVVDSTMSISTGRAGARTIYYDCDDQGPTLWILGGKANITSSGATRTFIISEPIDDAYDTCPVPEKPPVFCNQTDSWSGSISWSRSSSSSSDDEYHTSEASHETTKDSDSGKWWSFLGDSSSSDDNSPGHFYGHWRR